MIKRIEKLYLGKYADIRDYEVKEALKKEETIIVYYGKGKMVLNPQKLRKNRLLLNKTPIKSKVNVGQTYYLYSYLWEPIKELELNSDEHLKKFSEQVL